MVKTLQLSLKCFNVRKKNMFTNMLYKIGYFFKVSADFFCPVKKCFEFASEANFRKSTIPEYKREYEEIENR